MYALRILFSRDSLSSVEFNAFSISVFESRFGNTAVLVAPKVLMKFLIFLFLSFHFADWQKLRARNKCSSARPSVPHRLI
jgi:hypothetical protein